MDHLVHFVGSHSPVVTFIASSWALGTVYVLYLVLTHLDCRAIGTSPMRDDLEMIPGSWPIIGNLLRTIKTGDRQLESTSLPPVPLSESPANEVDEQLGSDSGGIRRIKARVSL
jgi:hypothetical protein